MFITYYLVGSYSKAAELRSPVEASLGGKDERLQAEFYFYNAAVYEEMGDSKKAIELYRKSLDINKWRPIGWFKLGLLLWDSNPREAERCLQTCWDQDTSFTNALFPLSRLLAARKEWGRARDYLVTANARLPNNREISAALAEARRNAPGSSTVNTDYLVRRQITAAPPKVTPAPDFPKEGTIRIGLIERRNLVSVKAGGAFFIHAVGNNNPLYNSEAGDQFWVEWDKGALVVQGKNNTTLIRTSSPIVYELRSNQNTSIVAGVVNGSPGINRTYRGALEFQPGSEGMTVVNIVSMEDYLYGVVPSEMPYSWPAESLKVQAVAARSYAIANR